MNRCIVPPDALEAEECRLPCEAAHHLRTVLRARLNDPVQLLDGAGHRRPARITAIDRSGIRCAVCGPLESVPPPHPPITLYQCIAKSSRMDWLVEKAVELGASVLVPVLSRRCVVRLAIGETIARWDRLAARALEQCGGAWHLRIEPVCGWSDAVARVRSRPPVFVAALATGAAPVAPVLAEWADRSPESAAWCVGPEGDFAGDELNELIAAGAIPVDLGPRVLRTETAALYGLCALRLTFGGDSQ